MGFLEVTVWLLAAGICVCGSFLLVPVLVVTSPLWAPGLLVLYVFLRLVGLWGWVRGRLYAVYEWLLYGSIRPKRYLWLKFYNFLCWLFPQPKWKVMNYGYAIESENGYTIQMDEEEGFERYCYQLYHYVGTGMKEISSYRGLDAVEVGSGRGGGIAFLTKYLKPKTAIGVDISPVQVNFCNRNYTLPGLSFLRGDAENLPLGSSSADLVINVESSHCYGDMTRFVAEVSRVLKPKGHFLYTDFRSATDVPELEKALEASGLRIAKKEDISRNVLKALQLDHTRRAGLIADRVPRVFRPLLRHFSGTEGSSFYNQLQTGETLYLAYSLVKPEEQ
jgi:SAM-dependent methyltransferase